jgi:hypothetical protein
MLWDIPYSKNSNLIPRNSIFIVPSSRPPYKIKIQLIPINFGLTIIFNLVLLGLVDFWSYSLYIATYSKKKVYLRGIVDKGEIILEFIILDVIELGNQHT